MAQPRISLAVAALMAAGPIAAQWPEPKAPIPHAAVTPDPSRTYRAVFDATRVAEKPAQLVPALDMAGSELNALGVAGVPLRNAKFVIVFHGAALDGILDEAHYEEKYGVSNPNLRVIAELKKAGGRAVRVRTESGVRPHRPQDADPRRGGGQRRAHRLDDLSEPWLRSDELLAQPKRRPVAAPALQ